jgi:hypothetical protein
MIVHIDKLGDVTLRDSSNFREFHVDCDCPETERARIQKALATVGEMTDQQHVWVSEQWLRAQVPNATPDWQEGFAKMLAFAQKQGWIDTSKQAIRAHVKWR